MPDIYMDVDTALAEVPVNMLPLIDDGDFKTIEDAVAHNAAGMDLRWNFVTTGGSFTSTAVTPTSGGDYDWTHQGDGIYTIEIPASGGASINNDTEGFGWFSGKATGVLPWRGPIIGFRAAGINDKLIDSAYSTTRGLAGTALPDAAADAAGGLPISDAGGLDLDAQIGTDINAILADTNELQSDWVNGGRLDLILDARASQTSVDDLPTNAELATAMAAADDAVLAAIGTVDTVVDAIKLQTDQLQFDSGNVLADLRAIASAPVAVDTGTAGTISFISGAYVAVAGGTVQANVVQIDGENVANDGNGRIQIDEDAILAAIAALNNLDSAAVQAAAAAALTAYGAATGANVTGAWTTALAESYRATGATGTPAQLMYEILANMINAGISGTTKTAKKLDKATTAKTYQLDSATAPTAIEELT